MAAVAEQMTGKKVLIASDHAGYPMKARIERMLGRLGYEVEDLGADSEESADYADFAHPLAQRISSGDAERGILVCGTGLGMAYVANRYPKVRAAVVWSPEIAALSRKHNDANVLALPGRFLDESTTESIVTTWLETEFEGGRHQPRIDKIDLTGGSESGGESR
jgi:ribose 5-phosphate isomerase B